MVSDNEIFEACKSLKPNDVIQFETKMNRPAECRIQTAKVSSVVVEENEVSIVYVPCKLDDSVQCGFGCAFFSPQGNKSHKSGHYGWQWVKKVGEEFPNGSRYNPSVKLYKNPGYDLVNI